MWRSIANILSRFLPDIGVRRTIINVCLLSTLCTFACFSQERRATIQPDKPRIGDSIRLTYDPSAPKALLTNVGELTAEVLLLPYESCGKLLELPMRRRKELWETGFRLSDSVSMFFVRFVSAEHTDDNNEVPWHAFVYSADGTPRRHAHLHRAGFLQHGGNGLSDFRHAKDRTEALREWQEELKWHGHDLDTRIAYLYEQLADRSGGNLSRIAREADSLFYTYHTSPDTARRIAGVLRRIERKYVADSTIAAIQRLPREMSHPRDSVAQLIESAPDDSSRFLLLEKCVRDFPADTCAFGELYIAHLLAMLVTEHRPLEAIRVFDSASKQGQSELAGMAWNLIVTNAELDRALGYAERALSLARKPDAAERPAYMNVRRWDAWKTRELVNALDVYGFGLTKLGRHKEALAAYTEAAAKSEGDDEYLNERYIRSLIANDRLDEAMKRGTEFIRNGNASDSIAPLLKAAFARRQDTTDFDALLTKAVEARSIEEKKTMIASCLDLPLPACEYETLDGKKASLSEYSGKVVLLEFWATWCSPCRMSLPWLQKFFEEKKTDPRLAIIALNTSEIETKTETQSRVRKFLKEKKYTFPVLISRRGAICFEVDGLPSYVLIDREGRVQFKASGSLHHDETFAELQKRLDLLLSDDFHRRKTIR